MRRGIPLTDQDRIPWIRSPCRAVQEWAAQGRNVVLACSRARRSTDGIEMHCAMPSRIANHSASPTSTAATRRSTGGCATASGTSCPSHCCGVSSQGGTSAPALSRPSETVGASRPASIALRCRERRRRASQLGRRPWRVRNKGPRAEGPGRRIAGRKRIAEHLVDLILSPLKRRPRWPPRRRHPTRNEANDSPVVDEATGHHAPGLIVSAARSGPDGAFPDGAFGVVPIVVPPFARLLRNAYVAIGRALQPLDVADADVAVAFSSRLHALLVKRPAVLGARRFCAPTVADH